MTQMVRRDSWFSVPHFFGAMDLLVFAYALFMRFEANRPDVFPFLWWLAAVLFVVTVIFYILSLWARARSRKLERQQHEWEQNHFGELFE